MKEGVQKVLRRRKGKWVLMRKEEENTQHLSRKRTSGNDFLLSINRVDNEAAASGANDLLVDEYGHTVTTHVRRWSCIWFLSMGHTQTHTLHGINTSTHRQTDTGISGLQSLASVAPRYLTASPNAHLTAVIYSVGSRGGAARLLDTSDNKGAVPNKALLALL